MKSQLKLNRAGYCIYFVVIIAIALSFSGCKTPPNQLSDQASDSTSNPASDELSDPSSDSSTPPPPSSQLPSRTIPVTDEIIDMIKDKENVSQLYYYLSKPILLRLVSSRDEVAIADHELHLSASIIHDTFRITEFTPGLLQGNAFGNSLNVVFENIQGIPLLTFGKQGYGSSERYELTTNSNMEIEHNGSVYAVEYSGQERPYLLIVVVQELVG